MGNANVFHKDDPKELLEKLDAHLKEGGLSDEERRKEVERVFEAYGGRELNEEQAKELISDALEVLDMQQEALGATRTGYASAVEKIFAALDVRRIAE